MAGKQLRTEGGPMGETPARTADSRLDLTRLLGGTSGNPGTSWPTNGRLWRRGWLFATVWIAFLWYPATRAWSFEQPGWRTAALVAIVAYGALFLTTIWSQRRWRMAGEVDRHRPAAWAIVLGELVLATLMLPACGESAMICLVFTAISAMFVLPRLAAWIVVLAAACLPLAVALLVPGWEDGRTIGVGVLGAGIAIFGFLQLLDRNRELADVRQDLLEATQARERERLGRDVHDIVGHSLTVITLKSELAGRLLDAASEAGGAANGGQFEAARTQVSEIEDLARASLADVRAIVAGFRQVSLGAELATARSALADAGIAAEIPNAADEVPAERGELFGWLVREGVTNVIRHSGARHCAIELSAMRAAVLDDGAGVPTPLPAGGNGLAGLTGRAREAGAELEFTTGGRTRPGWGKTMTTVAISFPRRDPAPEPASERAAEGRR